MMAMRLNPRLRWYAVLTTAVLAGAAMNAAPQSTSGAKPAAPKKTLPPSASTDPRWMAWLGCWQTGVNDTDPLTCVVPVAGAASVDALTIVKGTITSRDSLDPD